MGMRVRECCGAGTLAVVCDAGEASLAFALACAGMGGACLLLTADHGTARLAARAGAVDFTVDTLCESLRILKNELRQRRAIAVALVGGVTGHVAEMCARGVQPDFAVGTQEDAGMWAVLVERGAEPLRVAGLMAEGAAGAQKESFALVESHAGTAAGRRAEDLRLQAERAAPSVTGVSKAARQWMEIAPRLFPRERERWYWAGQAEEMSG